MIADPKWAETMTEYGITNEAIETHVAKGRGFVEDWVIQHGYNLTEIQELIWPANGTEARYVPSLYITLLRSACSLECHPSISGNSTLPAFNFSQITEQLSTFDFMTTIRELDTEYIMEKAQQVFDFVLSSSAGILSILGDVLSSLGSAAGSVADFVVFVGTLLILLEVCSRHLGVAASPATLTHSLTHSPTPTVGYSSG